MIWCLYYGAWLSRSRNDRLRMLLINFVFFSTRPARDKCMHLKWFAKWERRYEPPVYTCSLVLPVFLLRRMNQHAARHEYEELLETRRRSTENTSVVTDFSRKLIDHFFQGSINDDCCFFRRAKSNLTRPPPDISSKAARDVYARSSRGYKT